MSEWALQALDRMNAAIAVIDRSLNIIFWNEAMSKLSEIKKEKALGVNLCSICPKLGEKRYLEMFESMFETGQSRFCSSAIHKAFIYPAGHKDAAFLRQNLQTDPITHHNKTDYALIQVMDVTEDMHNQNKYAKIIENLKEGIREIEIAAEKKANYDNLTGVLNRQGLQVKIQKILANRKANACRMVVFFLDMDGFKSVNDTYGHIVGDALLQQVAGRLKSHIRQGDERNKDILARLGGDEFVITFLEISNMEDIVSIADKIVSTVRKPFYIDNNKIQISLSLGIALYPDDGTDYPTVIQRADQAMYRVKQSGKDRYGFYDQRLDSLFNTMKKPDTNQ